MEWWAHHVGRANQPLERDREQGFQIVCHVRGVKLLTCQGRQHGVEAVVRHGRAETHWRAWVFEEPLIE